jgi:hypothetical protein
MKCEDGTATASLRAQPSSSPHAPYLSPRPVHSLSWLPDGPARPEVGATRGRFKPYLDRKGYLLLVTRYVTLKRSS